MSTRKRIILIILIVLCVEQGSRSQVFLSTCSSSSETVTVTAYDPIHFQTPGYKLDTGSYTSNLHCVWVFDAGAGNVLQLLLYFDTHCSDKISGYYGQLSTDTHSIVNVCGKDSRRRVTPSRYMRVEFTSDGSFEGVGLYGVVSTGADSAGTGCTSPPEVREATTEYQLISSQFYPNSYFWNMNCQWQITAPRDTIEVVVLFGDMESPGGGTCSADYLTITYNGKNQDVCGLFQVVDLFSASDMGSVVDVTFKTNGVTNRRGFFIKYRYTVETESINNSTTTENSGLSSIAMIGISLGGMAFLVLVTTIIGMLFCKDLPVERVVQPRRQREEFFEYY